MKTFVIVWFAVLALRTDAGVPDAGPSTPCFPSMCFDGSALSHCVCWERGTERRCWSSAERCETDRAHGGRAKPGENP